MIPILWMTRAMKMTGKLYMKKGKVTVRLRFDPITNNSQKLFQVTISSNQKTTYLMKQLNNNQQQTINNQNHHRRKFIHVPLSYYRELHHQKSGWKNSKKPY